MLERGWTGVKITIYHKVSAVRGVRFSPPTVRIRRTDQFEAHLLPLLRRPSSAALPSPLACLPSSCRWLGASLKRDRSPGEPVLGTYVDTNEDTQVKVGVRLSMMSKASYTFGNVGFLVCKGQHCPPLLPLPLWRRRLRSFVRSVVRAGE